MKIIIVGGTGFIGGAILRHAINCSEVTSILALSRRELPADVSTEEKVKTVIMNDFSVYSEEVIEELQGYEACIWAMGGRRFQFESSEAAHLANVDYPHSAAKIFAQKLNSAAEGKKFRFVYCSGAFTERDQSKKLLFLSESRKLKGEAETGLLKIEESHPTSFEVLIAQPAGVLKTDGSFTNVIYGPVGIGVGYLSHAMVDLALHGSKDQVIENAELRAKGRRLAMKIH